MIVSTRAVDVFLWDRHVGVVSPVADGFNFQYDEDYVRAGVEVSPIVMPLRTRPYSSADFGLPPNGMKSLPGFLAESFQHWIDFGFAYDWLDEHGCADEELTPLDLLAFVGRMSTGALSFEPTNRSTVLFIRNELAERNDAINDALTKIDADKSIAAIQKLCSLIDKPERETQSKALVGWNRSTGRFLIDTHKLPENYERWIAKFSPTADDDRHGCRTGSPCAHEYECAKKAVACGVRFSECRLLSVEGSDTFMTRRFDCDGCEDLHTLTLRSMIQLTEFSTDTDFGYERLFEVADALRLPLAEKESAFRRVAFNILAGETDCHARNISFTMTQDGTWHLAPAYDITLNRYAPGEYPWGGWELPHRLSVNGKFINIKADDLLVLADRFNVTNADEIIADVSSKLER